MIVSTKGRYALRVMIDLARRQTDKPVSLQDIADRQKISKKYLEIVLKSLVEHKFILGKRGKDGGYVLARTPEKYTVGSILKLSEGDMAPVACLKDDAPVCPQKEHCPTVDMWTDLNRLLNNFFASYSLADLAFGKKQTFEFDDSCPDIAFCDFI